MCRSQSRLSVVVLTLLLAVSPAVRADEPALPERAINQLGTHAFRHLSVKATGVNVLYVPGGKYLASWTDDHSVRLWHPDKGTEVREFHDDQAPLKAVAFSRDGRLLATGNSMGTLRLWEVETGKQFQEFPAHQKEITGLAFGAEGKSVVSGSLDKTVKVWDIESRKLARELGEPGPRVTAIAMNAKGDVAAAGHKDGSVIFWEIESGKEVRRLKGDGTAVFGLAFTADNKQMIVGCQAIIHLFDLESGKDLRQFGKPVTDSVDSQNSDRCLALSPDGSLLVVAGLRGVRVYDVQTAKDLRGVGAARKSNSVTFSEDGKAIAFDGFGQEIRRGDPVTGQEIRPDGGHRNKVACAVYSTDGRRLYSGSADKSVIIWDAEAGKAVQTLTAHNAGVTSLALSPDGKVLASGDGGGDVHIWDTETGKDLAAFKAMNGKVWALQFAPDGKTLATAGGDEVVRIWNWKREKKVSELEGHAGGALSLCFSPDAKMLAVGTGTGVIHIWSLDSDTEMKKLGQPARQPLGQFMVEQGPDEVQAPSAVMVVRFSGDGCKLAAWNAGGSFMVWDVSSGEQKRRVDGPREGVSDAVFSPDGLTVALGTKKRSLQVWELVTGQLRAEFAGHEAPVWGIAFSPDGRRLASASEDCTLIQWDLTGRLKNGKIVADRPGDKELEAMWGELATDDAEKAHRAIWGFALGGNPMVAWLQQKLKPAPLDPKHVDKLISQLDSASFAEREEAREALEELGDLAEKALVKSLTGKPSLEMRDRLEKLVEKVKRERDALNPHRTRVVRVIEALGQIGTPEARGMLKELADAPPEARLTEEVKVMARQMAERLGGTDEKVSKEPATP